MALNLIADNDGLGAKRADIPPQYRAYGVGSHIIIYQPQAEFVQVVRILHQHMNRADHL